jgi:phosphatidylcholine synthase
MGVGQRHLFAIHLLTASGAAFALLAVLAIADGRWRDSFIWLGIALLVDGIDGPLARRHRVRERLPKWDGAALDFVIDYATYVFAPAIIAARALELPPLVGAAVGLVIAVSGALYFADTRMKQADNSFRGFPAVWNMAVFVLYAFLPPPPVTAAIVVALAVLTFLPVNFVHPVRVIRWRPATLAVLAVWLVSGAWLLATDFGAPAPVKFALLAATAYLLSVAAVQQYLRATEMRDSR